MMKMNKRMVSLLVLGLACLMVTPGCRKTKNPNGGAGELSIDRTGRVGEGGFGDEFEIGVRLPPGMDPYPAEFAPVYFDYDSAQMNQGERMKANIVADEMRNMPDTQLIVEGHCDERGDREYNMALGERRALAVRSYIIELGVDPGRITTKSYGEENPMAPGHDEASYQQNRRGEMLLFTP